MKLLLINILFFSFLAEGIRAVTFFSPSDPFERAVYDKKIELVRQKIEEGVDIDKLNSSLKWVKNNKIEIIKLLIENGADVNTRDEDGKTALHYVNSVEMAKLLIDNGADVNAMSNKGQTPCDTAFEGPLRACDNPKYHYYSKNRYKEVRNFIIKQGGTGGKECKYIYFRAFKATICNLFYETYCKIIENHCEPIGHC